MRVHNNENISPFDVDGTLIEPYRGNGIDSIGVEDPLQPGKYLLMVPNYNNIRLLKEEYHRGHEILVWSRGGSEWAVSVIKALGLEQYVSDVYTKPLVYFDDLDIKEWLNQRVFIPIDAKYK